MSDAITAEGLVKRYGEVTALDGLSFSVPQGTVLALLGAGLRRPALDDVYLALTGHRAPGAGPQARESAR